MKITGFVTALLAAVLLCGCEAAADSRDDTATAGLINPYPAGDASPFFFRSAADWQQYADQQSAQAQPRD